MSITWVGFKNWHSYRSAKFTDGYKGFRGTRIGPFFFVREIPIGRVTMDGKPCEGEHSQVEYLDD